MLFHRQGDQMSLQKIAQNVAQYIFGQKSYTTFTVNSGANPTTLKFTATTPAL
jgi:hypothetical protein